MEAILIIILVLEALTAIYYIYNIISSKKVVNKSNLIYVLPLLLFMFVLYFMAGIVNKSITQFIDIFPLFKYSLKAFGFDYEKDYILSLLTGNILYKIDFYFAYLMSVFTTISVSLAFFIYGIKTLLKIAQYRKSGFDCLIADEKDFLKYKSSHKKCILWLKNLDKDKLMFYRNNKIYYFVEDYNSSGFKKIAKKSNGEINFIILDDIGDDKITMLFEYKKFISENSGCSKKTKLFINANKSQIDVLNETLDLKNIPSVFIFNKYNLFAKEFMMNYPLSKYIDNYIDKQNSTIKENSDIKVIFVGFGDTSSSLLSLMIPNYSLMTLNKDKYEPYMMNYIIFDRNKVSFENKYSSATILNYEHYKYGEDNFAPYNKNYKVLFEECDIHNYSFLENLKNKLNGDSFAQIIISYDDDENNLNLALIIEQKLKQWRINKCKIFVRIRNSKHIAKLCEAKPNIIVFGDEKNIINHQVIVNEKLDYIAKHRAAVYGKYTDLDKWNELNHIKKESNQSVAINLEFKLNLLGYSLSGKKQASIEEFEAKYYENKIDSFKDIYKVNHMNTCARIEHQRWSNFMLLQGFLPMSKKEIYYDSELKKVIKDDYDIKIHGCITSFEGLEQYHDYIATLAFENKLYDTLKEAQEGVDTYQYDYEDLMSLKTFLTATNSNLYYKE